MSKFLSRGSAAMADTSLASSLMLVYIGESHVSAAVSLPWTGRRTS